MTRAAEGIVVLVVDDMPAIVRSLAFGLRVHGFTVLTAANGTDALAILRAPERIDVLLSDVVMPGGPSGPELARSGLALRPDLKILLTTGYAHDMLAELGAPANEFTVIAKPYALAFLVERILAMVGVKTQ